MDLNRTGSPPGARDIQRPPEYAPAKPTGSSVSGSGPEVAGRIDPLDKRQVFRQMVVASLESGFLRYSKRKALLAYAARIGISEFDAMLLIAEAQFYADRIEPDQVDLSLIAGEPARVAAWSPGTQLLLALALAGAVDLALIYWLLV